MKMVWLGVFAQKNIMDEKGDVRWQTNWKGH